MKRTTIQTLVVSCIAGMFGAFLFNTLMAKFSGVAKTTLTETNRNAQMARYPGLTAGDNNGFVRAAQLSTSSVVFIKTVSESKYNEYDIFDFYFGGGGNRRVAGAGSGVIFTSDGYIVTNNHVIEDAETIEVIHEKKSYKAKIIGLDPSSDLAILKIEANNLPNIRLGRSKDLQVGEWVIAVGNPFNLTSTVTAGIVSAKGRNIQLLGGQFPLESFIQTDAAINPGNSGGALVNMDGELVGINTAILSRTGSYTGYGFAVPVDIVAKVFNDIIQYGGVQKAFMGLEVSDINSDLANRYKLNINKFDGAIITALQVDGVAQKAGLQEGDVITFVNEDSVTSKSNFEEQLSYYRPGDKIKITYQRGGQEQQIEITLENIQGTTGLIKSEVFVSDKLGVDLEAISKAEKSKLGLNSGVRVVKVRGGLFAQMRIPEGFVILAINQKPTEKPEDVENLLAKVSGKVVIEGVSREGVRGYYSFFF